MSTVHKIDRSKVPSPFTNHILIEPVGGGFQASGVSVVNRKTKHLSSRIYRTYDDALREAMGWSIEHGIPEIFVLAMEDGTASAQVRD